MLKKNRKGYLYLLPAILILGIFVFYPIINTIIFSFDETEKIIDNIEIYLSE